MKSSPQGQSNPREARDHSKISLVAQTTLLLLIFILTGRAKAEQNNAEQEPNRPNIVIIYADDLGYGDLGCYGSKTIRTPHLDRLAAGGVRMTNFYTAQPVCSASRAALLTGCYPNRIGIYGALGPAAEVGIHAEETTSAELLKNQGYQTAIFGKWHLGHHRQFLPIHHGFDEYFGIPYSNDMSSRHSLNKSFPEILPVIDGDQIVEEYPDQNELIRRYTDRAVRFIETNHPRPFFLYVPHTMPHVPLGASTIFRGRSAHGLYGDVIEEIDESVGQIVAALARHGLLENTLIVFSSDNGPWLSYGEYAGSRGSLREGKMTTFEGGVRVPGIFHWPGKLPAGATVDAPAMTIDIFPTIASLIDAELPANRPIDGQNILSVLQGQASESLQNRPLYFYWLGELQAVRRGRWKLHFAHDYQMLVRGGKNGMPGEMKKESLEKSLFDLEADAGETNNLLAKHPEVVKLLEQDADLMRQDLGDTATKTAGKNVRPAGILITPAAQGAPKEH